MKELDELIVQKLVAEQKTQKTVDNDANDCNNDPCSDSDEDKYSSDYFEKDENEDNEEYAPFRLFSEQEANNISILRNKIDAEVNTIIEKKQVEILPSQHVDKKNDPRNSIQ